MQHKLSELFPLCINWNILNLIMVSILHTLYTGKKNQGKHNQIFFLFSIDKVMFFQIIFLNYSLLMVFQTNVNLY